MTRWTMVLLFSACAAAAQVPDVSQRPVSRPDAAPADVRLEPSGAIATSKRDAVIRGGVAAISPRPRMRTPAVVRAIRKQQQLAARGGVCGDPGLQGKIVGAVPGHLPGCGVAEAIRLRSISGVALSEPAVMDCPTAQALKVWINASVKPTLRDMGGGVASLRVAGHYVCRTRNHKRGARISEHGKGRAIDISGFTLEDGSVITVLKGWRSRESGQALRQMHSDACVAFGTVLGPNSDRFHQDHFHFDTARYRSGTYCR
ncbi:hypothetical protein So717_39430 [Roseobacter cerasinus]|uniref:Extensin-like C-terminal domain-containing protein n=1 Tax=Roseobacter cerasinus TaxID=2602289 RepID=A0A640VXU7_9RHOB|nr:extensin family protein [Roseobacter cerasinus]GFE52190.1 hypothetical protein So717_39430 [Roseobacter cerasinus]